ncbi:hypothetical protein JZ751_000917 [Albula glossodonta]|uniref:Uncharacterized protein n=1 Tax=Albula glossodonta TaxID=121402 RepID=A0A8T2PXM6_9TELE|nr:hypothetical protein JZ751_000917 [Albula glossodonta]
MLSLDRKSSGFSLRIKNSEGEKEIFFTLLKKAQPVHKTQADLWKVVPARMRERQIVGFRAEERQDSCPRGRSPEGSRPAPEPQPVGRRCRARGGPSLAVSTTVLYEKPRSWHYGRPRGGTAPSVPLWPHQALRCVKYKKDFEESKGRGFSIVSDTPELQRLRKTQEQISNRVHRATKKDAVSPLGVMDIPPPYQVSKSLPPSPSFVREITSFTHR